MFRTLLVLAALALPAAAGDSGVAHNLVPGSLLLYPHFDNRPGSLTFLTATNTHPTQSVNLHFIYVDGEDCLMDNAFEVLTPRDTITALTSTHAPSAQQGFAWAYAISPTTGGAVTFDHVIGSVHVIDGTTPVTYTMNPVVFAGRTGAGNPTDVDGDGVRDLDGVEYEMVPDQIAIPRFLGQADGGMYATPFRSELVLVGLTGTQFTTSLSFQIFNDNEEAFSAQRTFQCWDRVSLLEVSGAFGNTFLKLGTNHDPDEIKGMPAWESGWILIDGGVASSSATSIVDPAFLAVLLETGRISSAALPFGTGSQTNGDLLPQTVLGDF